MALLSSLILPLGTSLIPFSLPDPDGKIHRSEDYEDRKVLVIMFICNHCPYVQAVRQRLIDLQANYDPKIVQFIGINANDWTEYLDDSPEEMKKAIKDYGINFPYLIDEAQEVARAYQAQCTPDIFVFSNNNKNREAFDLVGPKESKREGLRPFRAFLAYHGRIDDNWKDEKKVTRRELKKAIDVLLEGRKPPEPQHPCMGCSIKWLERA